MSSPLPPGSRTAAPRTPPSLFNARRRSGLPQRDLSERLVMKHQKFLVKTKALTRQLATVSTVVLGMAAAGGCTGVLGGDEMQSGNGSPTNPSAAGTSGSGALGGDTAGNGTGGSGSTAPLTGPGRVVMHRLNIVEYNNTVRDLLATSQRLPETFPADFTAFGFDNVASALTFTDIQLGYFSETAKRIATEVLSPERRSGVLECDLLQEKEACVTASLNALLPRAWRRPVEAGDVEPLARLYTACKADGNTEDEAFSRVLQAVLLAPEFLYRVERNSGVAGVRDLTGYEVASRLSYFLWSTMPDAELTAAAASGSLKDTAGLASQLTRMLASEKAAAFSENFGSQWLPVRELDNARPSQTVYAEFDEELRSAMAAETMRFFVDVARGTRPLPELFTSNSGYVNDRLAEHYGMDPVGSDQPVFTKLPANRTGLLTQGTFLTAVAYTDDSHPVKRGKWMLAHLLCQEPPEPNFAIPEPPERAEGSSRKEQLAAHQTEPICKACHVLMDPLGLALEQYDGIGSFRTEDRGAPIDPSGVFRTAQGDVPFANPAELSQLVAAAPSVSGCVAKHVFAYGLGRGPRPSSDFDIFILDEAGKAFAASGQHFPKLVEALVTSDVFRKREDEASAP